MQEMTLNPYEDSPYVPNVHFTLIRIRDLVSNQEYQRDISATHIKNTASNFDVYQLDPVKVSRRDGVNYVFDGQHTAEIVALVSGSRDTPVWCMVYDDLTYTKEANIFANQQKGTKPLAAYDIFRANIEAGNEKQLMIEALVNSYGLAIRQYMQPGTICAISSLEYIYEKYSYKMLDRVLRICSQSWEGAPMSFGSCIMKGLAKFLAAYDEQINDDTFIERISKFSIKEIVRAAKERHAGTHGYAEALLIYYNKKSRNSLPWEPLYAYKAPRQFARVAPDEESGTTPENLDEQQTMDIDELGA